MLRYKILKDENDDIFIDVDSDGYELLHNPILNKGSAFSIEERRLFNIDGFLPSAVSTIEDQVARAYENYQSKPSDIEKYIFLRGLQDRNEVLFYALLQKYLNEMIHIIYTPTVGKACQTYSHIFRWTRGIFLSPENIDRADSIFQALPYRNIEVIVATDSEGILGLGDQGIGGMGIPVGKLSLYIAGAGINPANCLPICLDVGTDNAELQNDPLYLGMRQRRLRGVRYFEFVDQFVEAVKRNFPKALLQWEDFSKQRAFSLLDKYRASLPSFNDDIQGTGAVVVAGVNGALRIKKEKLSDQVFVIYGAGAAGVGVGRQILSGLRDEGLSEDEACKKIIVLDSQGVLVEDREGLDNYKLSFCKTQNECQVLGMSAPDEATLLDVITCSKATVLLGLSGRTGTFTEEIVKTMAGNCEEPVIFPLSNPTSSAEATPADICNWTKGKAIVATGSPFPDINYEGHVFKIGQGNNVFIFPGVGMGSLAVRAQVVTDEMLTAASVSLAEQVSDARLNLNCVYPPISELHEVSLKVAVAVARKAIEQGVARKPIVPELIEETIRSKMWIPRYARFTRGTAG
jgi:malate dehydrogenase (oxaloacetate-decarboxylating)